MSSDAPFPLLVDRTLAVFDSDFVMDSAFFRDSFVTSDVSPILDPDFKGTTVVIVPSSIETLETFFVSESFAETEDRFEDAFLVTLASFSPAFFVKLDSFSSTVNVEALRNNGGVGDSRSLPSDGEDPESAISLVFFEDVPDGNLGSEVGLAGVILSVVERLANLLGVSSGVAKVDLRFTPGIVLTTGLQENKRLEINIIFNKSEKQSSKNINK